MELYHWDYYLSDHRRVYRMNTETGLKWPEKDKFILEFNKELLSRFDLECLCSFSRHQIDQDNTETTFKDITIEEMEEKKITDISFQGYNKDLEIELGGKVFGRYFVVLFVSGEAADKLIEENGFENEHELMDYIQAYFTGIEDIAFKKFSGLKRTTN